MSTKVGMDKKRRFVFTTGQKLLLWIVGLLVVWQLFQNETVVNAILTFSFAGVVPGTHIVLSPDVVMQIVAAIFFVAMLFLLMKLIRNGIKRRGSLLSIEPAVVAPTLRQSIATSQPEKERRHYKIKKPNMSWVHPYTRKVLAGRGLLNRNAQVAAQMLQNALRVFGAWCTTTNAWALKVLQRVYRIIADRCTVSWQQVSPYLWKFDSWLALQVHRSKDWATRHLKSHEAVRILISIGHEYKKTASGFQPKAFRVSIKQQFFKLLDELRDMLKSKV